MIFRVYCLVKDLFKSWVLPEKNVVLEPIGHLSYGQNSDEWIKNTGLYRVLVRGLIGSK